MARARRNREVNIFNFSFLDILACTVGALTFILVMVVVINVGSLPADLVTKLDRMAEELDDTRAENEAAGIALENQIVKDDLITSQEEDIEKLSADLDAALAQALAAEQEAAMNRDIIDAMSAGQAQDEVTQEEIQRLINELATSRADVERMETQLAAANQTLVEMEESPSTSNTTEENWWHRLGMWRWLVMVVGGVMLLLGLLALWSIAHLIYLQIVKGETIVSHRVKKQAPGLG
ncbi:MAG: hypothetical protein GY906_29480 [bacterium]|nr:hypothetical protein [bacterium]